MFKVEKDVILGARYMPSPNTSGTLRDPSLLVLHYTASGGTPDPDAKYFQREGTASAHLVIGRDGTIVQCVPFNKKAWHAGKSSWKGRRGCNHFSIGIELDNWGLLSKKANGNYYSYAGVQVSADKVFVAKNKQGKGQYWEDYSEVQLHALKGVISAILAEYPTISEIVGQEDVSPGRKIDPGPALYPTMDHFNSIFLEHRNRDESYDAKVVTIDSDLNLRETPGGKIIGSKEHGSHVTVLYEMGDWARVSSGWLHCNYLMPI